MNYKLSVIIPIYNADQYLKRCIDSVIKQSIGFENIELILVDDNSTDDSKKIIKEYCDKYNNIRGIFLNENHGTPSFGRNKGIEISSAEYIMFLDSDDEFDCEICEKLYDVIRSNDVDLVQCNHIHKDDVNVVYRKIPDNEKENDIFYGEDIINHISLSIWDKIFKKSLIIENGVFFKEKILSEDNLFIVEYCLNSNKLIKLNGYHGYIYYGSHLSSYSINFILNIINVCHIVYRLSKEHNVQSDIFYYFGQNINIAIGSLILISDISLKDIYLIIKKLYELEIEINFNNSYLNVPFIRFINNLIITNHFNIAKYVIYFLNRLANKSIFRTIYRKKYS